MKFRILDTQACYVTWTHEIEATSKQDATEKYRNGACNLVGDPEIGDSLDFGSDIEVQEIKE